MIKITRAEAHKKLEAHWTQTGHCSCCSNRWSSARFSRLRNYEIEQELEQVFGKEHVIWEPCPFNGVFCRWGTMTGAPAM